MAKRRTRAQKIRAQGRRTTQLKTVVKKVTDTLPTDAVVSAVKGPTPPSFTAGPDSYRRRDLRLSLVVLGALILVQIILWLVFLFTNLDTKLYDLIKV